MKSPSNVFILDEVTGIQQTLQEMLDNHILYLNNDPTGVQLDLTGKFLNQVDLNGVDLRDSILVDTSIIYSDLSGVNFSNADLTNANFLGSYFEDSIFANATLSYTQFVNADLTNANFSDANLFNANLRKATKSGLITNVNTQYYDIQCPALGTAFTGYKKAGEYLIELLVPADAQRSSATGDKCRVDKATVVAITKIADGTPGDNVFSDYDDTFLYKIGQTVVPDSFDTDRWNECSNGIHLFLTKDLAKNYNP